MYATSASHYAILERQQGTATGSAKFKVQEMYTIQLGDFPTQICCGLELKREWLRTAQPTTGVSRLILNGGFMAYQLIKTEQDQRMSTLGGSLQLLGVPRQGKHKNCTIDATNVSVRIRG